jgi:hypothetical protein
VLTGDQRTDVQNLYNLVWTMYRTPQLSNTARGRHIPQVCCPKLRHCFVIPVLISRTQFAR